MILSFKSQPTRTNRYRKISEIPPAFEGLARSQGIKCVPGRTHGFLTGEGIKHTSANNTRCLRRIMRGPMKS